MPGVWLGENSVPELTKIDDDLIGFAHDTNRRVWPGVLFVAGIGIPCTVLCVFLALYAESPINPIFLNIVLFAFALTVIAAVSYACWCVDATVIDRRSRIVIREYYFLGKQFYKRTVAIRDEDFFAIIVSDDDHGTGVFHRIYLCRTKPLILFASIHLPSAKPSGKLMEAVNEMAYSLRIKNLGYISWHGFLGAWARFISGKT